MDAAPSSQRVMPSPLWRGAARIGLMCDTGIAPALCDVIADEARRRSLLPVTPISRDHRATKADRDTVIVAVAIEQHPQGEHLVVVVRRAVEIDDAEIARAVQCRMARHGAATTTDRRRVAEKPASSSQRREQTRIGSPGARTYPPTQG
ncbi:hypothetical protein [Sphingomonas sp. 22R3R2A-7]|uniref:hypothetical protein n=1 Tax=Sphingomonas sp. 22R3R2A-7 TaxID=3050230 RepID=UPI002FDF1BD3